MGAIGRIDGSKHDHLCPNGAFPTTDRDLQDGRCFASKVSRERHQTWRTMNVTKEGVLPSRDD